MVNLNSIQTDSLYRRDIIICQPGLNFNGAADFYMVPGQYHRPIWPTQLA